MSAKEVIWLDTGQRFESTHEAAEKTGVSRTALRNALKKGIPCKGLHFCYADSLMDEGATFQTKTVSNMVVGQTTVIRFVGEIPRQAEIQTGIRHGTISCAASGMAGGYHWEYIDD